ncbi:MAG: hypothetical protein OXU42_08325 [Deltaproteobacteria bacterium]|nr:hypothetical protein [Deltaproteobacteria bacterium]
MNRELLPYQSRWVQDRSGIKVIQKSRRIGLSWAEAYDSVLHAAAGAGNVYYQSYNKDMTRSFIDDCEGWAKVLEIGAAAVGETLIDLDAKDSVLAYCVNFPSGKQILAMPSSPRVFRSKGRAGDRAIIDEAAFVDDLEASLKAAMAFRMWRGDVHVLSTHHGEGSSFNQLVREVSDGTRMGSLHTVTFRHALDEGFYRRICEVNGEEWTDEGEAAYEQEVRAEYGADAEEELDCIPSAAGGSWLSWDQIRAVEHPDAGRPDLYRGGLTFIGNDIARRKHLWVAWVLEVVGDVVWTREVSELRNASFSEQDGELDRLVKRYRPVLVSMDQTGMGEKPVEDARRRYGESRVEGVLLTSPRRLGVAIALKERCEDRRLRIPSDNAIRGDFHSIRKEPGATGGPRLVADDDGESHADRFWAAALACAAAAMPRGPVEGRATDAPVSEGFERGGGRVEVDAGLGVVRPASHDLRYM